jgi:hypothetical protein
MAETNTNDNHNDNNATVIYYRGYVWSTEDGVTHRVALQDLVALKRMIVGPPPAAGVPVEAVLDEALIERFVGADDAYEAQWPAVIWGPFVGVPVNEAKTQWDVVDIDRALGELARGEDITVERRYGQVQGGACWRHTVESIFSEPLDKAICAALGLKVEEDDAVEVTLGAVHDEKGATRQVVRVTLHNHGGVQGWGARCTLEEDRKVQASGSTREQALKHLKSYLAEQLLTGG